MSNQVKDMTWREVQERLREFPVVIVVREAENMPACFCERTSVCGERPANPYWNRCLFGGSIG